MKRTLIIMALVLIISTSVIAGTLSMYVVKIDDLAEGSVVAKEFILLENGADTFATGVTIAPGEEVEWKFGVKNYDGEVVTETAMDLDFKVEISADGDKLAIEPLVVTVKDEEETRGTKTGVGEITFADEFSLEETGQEKTYTVNVKWPSNDEVDINYVGSGFGTALKVSVTGTQQEPEEPEEP